MFIVTLNYITKNKEFYLMKILLRWKKFEMYKLTEMLIQIIFQRWLAEYIIRFDNDQTNKSPDFDMPPAKV